MPKHPEDGQITEQAAKARAEKALADPRHHGKPDDVERTRDDELTGHDQPTTPDPAWRKSGETWIHEEEG